MTKVTDAYGNATRCEYSLTGQLTKVTDALGNETEYRYDVCDRLIEVLRHGEEIEGDGAEDALDGALSLVERQDRADRACRVTCYQRNKLGQVESITDALGNTEHYTYDAKGQLIEKLDKEGYLTKYGYTAQGDVEHIAYADGREVKLSYNPLRQLEEMEDWLGITKIENDALGRALRVQHPDGKEVSYTYGKSGERTGLTYPDGRQVTYSYDDALRLSGLSDGNGTITYGYDGAGRLARKAFPGGMETTYAYDAAGHLSELIHRDREGILDRYSYRYDLLGNKAAIEKQRRGLPEESGLYAYGYDALGRLSTVAKDGQELRSYGYDAFGNRTRLREGSAETTYTYNAMDQLVSKADALGEETYAYDKRGNLDRILKNGVLKNRYTYGALNRLEQAVRGDGEAASYLYNGLGHRVGKDVGPETKIRYTIDLTKSYHNLLQKEEDRSTQTYLWDGNVAGMWEEAGVPVGRPDGPAQGAVSRYYLQDELGSPIRLFGEGGGLEESYGYDEFGRDLYGNQGRLQPFGYTGYQADHTAGTYYAQAREYRAELGRFAVKDKNKYYKMAIPESWNLYVYCENSPTRFVDWAGSEIKNPMDIVKDYMENGIDLFGISIGMHWLYGGGKEKNICTGPYRTLQENPWQAYMQDNAILTGKVGDIVIPIGESLKYEESIEVDMNISMIIDNGEGAKGYQFLHGTNAYVGGFQISGNISKNKKGDVSYDLTYTWNDRMDPEFKYSTDREKANAAQLIPGADPMDYDFHLSWHDKSIIRNEPNYVLGNYGWLREYTPDWQNRLSGKEEAMMDLIDYQQGKNGAPIWAEQLQDIYATYSSYYGCGGLE